jgi:hypothetical protein
VLLNQLCTCICRLTQHTSKYLNPIKGYMFRLSRSHRQAFLRTKKRKITVLERTWDPSVTSVAETKLKGRLECKPVYIKTKLKLCFLTRKHNVSPNTTSNGDAFPYKETQRFSKYHYRIQRGCFSLQGNTTFLQIPLPHHNGDAFPYKETQRFSKYHYHIQRGCFSLQGNTTFLQIPLPHPTGTLHNFNLV